tara:strand:+ start:77 stop:832 length:756 start_codon:yes stop_codon:yes gene_type:complete
MDTTSNPEVKETQEANQPQSQEESKPLFGGTDSQGKERLFRNPEEAQQSWQSAQNFIKDKVTESKTLESRIQELEAQLNQSTKLDDALKHLNTKEESPVNEEQTQQATESTPQFDMEQLERQLTEKIMGRLSSSQQEEVFTKNTTESITAAQSIYGDAYEAKLRETAQELGMSDEDIIKEAQSNPKRFKKLFNLDKQTSQTLMPRNGITSFPKSDKPAINFNKGFSSKDKLTSHLGNLEAIAKAKGLNIKF